MPLILASVALASALAQVQPAATFPFSATVTFGRGQTWEDEGSVGSGNAIGGGLDFRFRPRWSVGVDAERLAHRRETAGPIFSGRTVFATAGITYHFTPDGVSPYAGGGFGGAFYKGEIIDRLTPSPTSLARSSTSTAVYGRAGVDIPIGERLLISPDLRITLCQSQDDFAPWSVIRFAVKGAVRF